MPIVLDGTLGITTPTYGGADTAEYITPVVGMKNKIINGSMMIDQRNAGASVTPTVATYTLDRWRATVGASSKFSVQQVSDAPTGFTNSLKITSLATTSLGATDYYEMVQRIEGYNVADLGWGASGASTVTLSFWVKSSLTGTFGGALNNADYSRSYPFTYTISAANTWEYKTITIAGDTTGTWQKTTSIGINLVFGLGVGSTYSGTAGTWASADYESATGATSVVGTNGATFYITGVQLEKGSTATSFDYRPYGTELALCQRYYQRWSYETDNKYVFGLGSAVATNEVDFSMPLGVTMRAIPTMTYSALAVYDGNNPNIIPSSITTYQASTSIAGAYFNGTGFTQYRPYFLRTTGSTGHIAATAEL